MAQIPIDFSGKKGLAPKYYGDVNSVSASPELRYLGAAGQFADGTFDPVKRYGYLSPANDTFATISGSTNALLVATEYDSINDDVFLAEAGAVIWQLDGLADTSLTTFLTVAQSGTEILNDLNIYEINGTRMLFYAYKISALPGGFSKVGVIGLDSDSGIYLASSTDLDSVLAVGEVVAGGSVVALAQSYLSATDMTFNRVRLPLTRDPADDGGYTVKASIQMDAWPTNTGSYDFDGNNDSLECADQAALDVVSDFTIELWVNGESTLSSGTLVSKSFLNDETTGAYRFYFSNSTTLTLALTDSANVVTTESVTYAAPTNEWIHLVVTRNRTGGEVKFYVNTVQQGATQAATTNALLNSNAEFTVSGIDSNVGQVSPFNGKIKEVRLWNDIRTQQEIEDNWKNTLVGNEANLAGYWKLNGDSFEDSTANNNDLSSSNPPTTSTSIPPGRPDGVVVASGTVNPTTIPADGSEEAVSFINFDLNTTITIDEDDRFWIVLEPTVFAEMTASDAFSWLGQEEDPLVNEFSSTSTAGTWQTPEQENDFDFALVLTGSQVWSSEIAAGADKFAADADLFMVNADNGFMYLFEKNRVHKVDGGITGGGTGTITSDVLVFPSYFSTVDAVDTRGRLYIGVQANPSSGDEDVRTYSEGVTGIYVWDRLSNLVGARDFVPLYGVRDIKKVYVTPQGEVRAICIGDDRFTEIRSVTNGGNVIKTLGISAYPEYRDSVKTLGNMTVWLAADGVVYAHGAITEDDTEELYKIGSLASSAVGAFDTGAIFVGNSEATQSLQALLLSYTDTISRKNRKWYPHGQGTISSVAQLGNIGNVYSLVTMLPTMSTVNSVHWRCFSTGTGSETVATIKYYLNNNTTPDVTKTITRTQASRGYVRHVISKKYVNCIQVEIEWSTTATLGTNDFSPMAAIVDYKDTTIKEK